MVKCEECGKKLGIFEGYRHPTLGKKHLLCNPCFDQVSESVARWQKFVLANSFNNGSSKRNLQLNWKEKIPSPAQIQDIFGNATPEKEIYMQE